MKVKTWPGVAAMALLASIVAAWAESTSDASEPAGVVATAMNLCVGQPANTFRCIDDTNFEQCTGGSSFVVNACARGTCATRHPASQKPCVGPAQARDLDGVAPTPPGQLDEPPPAPAVKNLCAGQPANTFHCTDDTSFQLCTGNDNYVVNACPKGFCATRHPASRNPCIGAARARQVDGVDPTPPGQ